MHHWRLQRSLQFVYKVKKDYRFVERELFFHAIYCRFHMIHDSERFHMPRRKSRAPFLILTTAESLHTEIVNYLSEKLVVVIDIAQQQS